MVSRENTIVVACVLLATALYFGVPAVSTVDLPEWGPFAIAIVIGILLPQMTLGYLENRTA